MSGSFICFLNGVCFYYIRKWLYLFRQFKSSFQAISPLGAVHGEVFPAVQSPHSGLPLLVGNHLWGCGSLNWPAGRMLPTPVFYCYERTPWEFATSVNILFCLGIKQDRITRSNASLILTKNIYNNVFALCIDHAADILYNSCQLLLSE